ncbi:MAG: DNA replication/repair protein RecF [Acidimicrobiales bacterium]|nr:DNA replication/repair protein RecF [Acidimicrobiales bacterium]MCB9372336.1 DNA replication/repair protein RecF [Microthrixaceae bacterium]
MHLRRLWLSDFRSYGSADVAFAPGLTAVVGDNGQGKSNLLEAVAYLATLSSFRGAPTEALVRSGRPTAVVRAEIVRDDRELLVEAEIVPGGRSRLQVNRQRVQRSRDLLGALRVSVFAPDDLALVKAGPAGRRRFLDDTLVALSPKNDELRSEVDRVLRQRNALLKQAAGRLSDEVALTLDVWDAKLADAGTRLGARRVDLLGALAPYLARAYADLAGEAVEVGAEYESSWWGSEAGLAGTLAAARDEELRRRVTLVGPHRDEVAFSIGGLPARTHASQGEQRSLALALRLAAHRLVSDATGTPPVLLLDDVFSELDPARCDALVTHLLATGAQTIVTTAGALPPSAHPEAVLRVADGSVGPGAGR